MSLDLFVEASRDLEAELLAERQAFAKVAVAGLWPFLALAEDPGDFEHRLALSHPRIVAAVEPDLVGSVLDGLRRDFTDSFGERTAAAQLESATAGRHQASSVRPGEQFFHPLKNAWVTVTAAQDLPEQPKSRNNQFGNPAYFEQATEEGPATGANEHPGFPQFPAGPDPWNPHNADYPMTPTPWAVPPGGEWVERPMQLKPGAGRSASRPASVRDIAQNAAHVARYDTEGVETGQGPNPGYFSGGSEGVGGDQAAGYPEDVALPEPNERVDYYGTVPPQQSGGSGQGGAQPYSNPGVPSDSQPTRQAMRHTAPGGGEHAPYEVRKVDGGYAVFNAKGERKNEEPKTEDAARQYQKALYRNVPGARESAEKAASRALGFQDPTDRRVRVLAQGDMAGAVGMPPPPPQSMLPGGPGATAGEPMAPGASSTSGGAGPGMGLGQDPGGADAASQANGRQTASKIDWSAISRAAAGMVRERPTEMNPSGVPDEYEDLTWESQAQQRPRQPTEQRGVNTPQTQQEPIPQASSSDALREQEEMRRQSALTAYARTVAGVR